MKPPVYEINDCLKPGPDQVDEIKINDYRQTLRPKDLVERQIICKKLAYVRYA